MNFLAPLFLVALAGLALPWLLHRMQQHHAEVTLFPSHKFLESTRLNSERRRKLRFRGLMLLRMLALLLLCLLFAQPQWQYNDTSQSNPEQLHLVVLDSSYSMQFGDRWERAQRKAEEVLAGINEDHQLQLVAAARSLSVETQNTASRTDVQRAVQLVSPRNERLDFARLAEQLDALAANSKIPVVAHFITDAQDSAMPVNLGVLSSAQLSQLLIHRIDLPEEWNLSIWGEAEWVTQNRLNVSASVAYSSDEEPGENAQPEGPLLRDVVLRRGDTTLAQSRVSLLPNQTQAVEFNDIDLALGAGRDSAMLELVIALPAAEAGSSQQSVSAHQSMLDVHATDDRAALKLATPNLANIYLLAQNTIVQEIDLVYLKTALADKAGVLLKDANVRDARIQQDADMLVYFSQDPVTANSQKLFRYLDAGGNVLQIISSDSASKLSTQVVENAALADQENLSGEAMGSSLEPDTVTQVSTSHPLLLDAAGWSEVTLYQEPSIDQSAIPDNADLLLRSNTGQVVLFELPRAQGRHLVLGLPLDGLANDLPLSPVFVPFVHRVVDYFLKNQAYPTSLYVGETLRLAKSAQVLLPDGEALFDIAGAPSNKIHSLSDVGLYTVIDRSGESFVRVSIDPMEYKVASVDQALLSAWEERASVAVRDNQNDDTMADKSSVRTLDLSKWLLPLMVVIAMIELFYSNRVLGRFRSGI